MKKRKKGAGASLTPWSQVREELLADPEVRFHYDEIKIRKALGAALAKARERAELTQANVAARAKTTQSVVARLETGKGGVPSLPLLHRIANVLGLEVNIGLKRRNAA